MATIGSLRGSGCRGRHEPACRKRAGQLEAGLRFPAWPMLPADRGRTGWIWQTRKDSNLRMPESESGALPLGDGAMEPILTETPVNNAARDPGWKPAHRVCGPGADESAYSVESWVARRALCRPPVCHSEGS